MVTAYVITCGLPWWEVFFKPVCFHGTPNNISTPHVHAVYIQSLVCCHQHVLMHSTIPVIKLSLYLRTSKSLKEINKFTVSYKLAIHKKYRTEMAKIHRNVLNNDKQWSRCERLKRFHTATWSKQRRCATVVVDPVTDRQQIPLNNDVVSCCFDIVLTIDGSVMNLTYTLHSKATVDQITSHIITDD